MGESMKKQEALDLLKRLLAECELDSDSFDLVEPDPKGGLSKGYKIRIMTTLDNDCREVLKRITKECDLAVIEEQSQIIVYNPKRKHVGNLILE
jgi:hypothetical protein